MKKYFFITFVVFVLLFALSFSLYFWRARTIHNLSIMLYSDKHSFEATQKLLYYQEGSFIVRGTLEKIDSKKSQNIIEGINSFSNRNSKRLDELVPAILNHLRKSRDRRLRERITTILREMGGISSHFAIKYIFEDNREKDTDFIYFCLDIFVSSPKFDELKPFLKSPSSKQRRIAMLYLERSNPTKEELQEHNLRSILIDLQKDKNEETKVRAAIILGEYSMHDSETIQILKNTKLKTYLKSKAKRILEGF